MKEPPAQKATARKSIEQEFVKIASYKIEDASASESSESEPEQPKKSEDRSSHPRKPRDHSSKHRSSHHRKSHNQMTTFDDDNNLGKSIDEQIAEKMKKREKEGKHLKSKTRRRRHHRHDSDGDKSHSTVHDLVLSHTILGSTCQRDTVEWLSSQQHNPGDRRESIAHWTESYNLHKAMAIAETSPEMEWLSSFYRCDPRWQILKFFNEVAREVSLLILLSPPPSFICSISIFFKYRGAMPEPMKT